MCDAAPGRRWSVALDLDEFGTGTTCPGLRHRGWAESRATLDTSARSTREDGGAPWTVPSESTPSWLSPPWALLAPSALGLLPRLLVPQIVLLPRLLVPQIVLLLVDGIVIGLCVLGLGTPGDVQVLADVGLGFVFGLPATRSTWGCSARTRAARSRC